MGARKAIGGAVVSMNLEFLSAIHTLQEGKALQRYFGCSRDKLEETSSLCLVK